MPDSNQEKVDVIVLGAGPAGVNCALELHECKISYLVIDRNARPGGQLPDIPSLVYNVAAGIFENGAEMQDRLNVVAQRIGLNIKSGEEILDCDLNEKTLRSKNNIYRARAIFLSTGYRVRILRDVDVSSEQVSSDICYHTGSAQQDFENKNIAIIGGGDSAVLEALERADTAKSVTIITRGNEYKARLDLIKKIQSDSRIQTMNGFTLEGLEGDRHLRKVKLRSTVDDTIHEIAAEKLIVKIGYCPNTEIFRNQVEMDATGHIRVDVDGRTSVDGVFAGGDIITPGFDRIAFAMGSGVLAARSIRKFLESQQIAI